MTERLTLPARLDSSAAPALMQTILGHRGRPVVLDASGVEVVGARAIEILIAAGRQWAADGLALAVEGPSDRYAATCAVLGVCAAEPWRPGPARATGTGA